ncbi:hypothetical protein FB45DRAFT_782951 [Roridomyces roridus]|uniref:F-box domain-containing protein n=1 Tax=Roridomyces roridus TaxID=1738132 RepID=A0AAD7G151_9AGAR|nr:hypothetical protein FB45DRAFT_782951 [Roridomyces roridus]
MHRALRIPELVDLIFEAFACTQPRRNKTLASLARTCRDFREPALDVLWREQTTLSNLLRLLPSHLWKIHRLPEDNNNCFFSGQLSLIHIIAHVKQKDWAAALSYSRRIKDLTVDWSGPEPFLHLTAFKAIATASLAGWFPGGFLCPSTSRLYWRAGPSIPDSFVHDFLCPSIHTALVKNFDLTMPLPSDSGLRSLRKLSFECCSNPHSIIPNSSRVVLGLNRIEELRVRSINREAFEHLSKLSTLKALEIRETKTMFTPTADSGGFPALRVLKLCRTSPEFANNFLSILPSHGAALHSLHFGIEVFTPQTLADLYASLSKHLLSPRRLAIVSERWMTVSPEYRHARDFAPLRAFEQLTHLHIEPPVEFDMDDVMAEDFARSWPNIQTLVLKSNHYELSRPLQTTLHCLRSFGEHCPKLARLAIEFDASAIPSSFGPSIRQTSLVSLGVGRSPIESHLAVRAFLTELFPNFREIVCEAVDWRVVELSDIQDTERDEAKMMAEEKPDEDDTEAWERWTYRARWRRV